MDPRTGSVMSIRVLLIGQVTLFVLLLAVVLGATLALARADGGDALYVNLAGRQRMLSQKLMVEAFALARDPTFDRRDQLESTMALFATSHRALRIGGQTPLGLDGSLPVFVSGAANQELIARLDVVEDHWKRLREGLAELVRASGRRREAITIILERNPRLLARMDQAVRYFAASDATPNVVNIAGRQRMLSQRTALQAILYDSQPSPILRDELRGLADLFEVSLVALRDGGMVPSRMDGSRPIAISGTEVPRILNNLEDVEDLWRSQKAALEVLIAADAGFHEALTSIERAGPKVLEAMNDAVLSAQRASEAKLENLQLVQLAALAAGLLLAALGGLLALSIGRSLRQLSLQAEAISRGELSERVAPRGIGEVRALS
ncbi:MAG: type IV pili methyl-accepting chemotaxis transducer N-terminal domain-containing protein, partial [Myxococcota bacterium]